MGWIRQIIERKQNTQGVRIEAAVFRPNVVVCTSLVSHDIAVGDHIEALIASINAQKPILRQHYFVTNTHEIRDDEVAEYLEKLDKEE